jgi:hypothetical protein
MRALVLIAALVAADAWAACSPDTSGTQPTVPNKGLPSSNTCFGCRELNKFPFDFTVEAYNYTQSGEGEFTHHYYFEDLSGFGPRTAMNVRSCNTIGQCATSTVITAFNVVGFSYMGMNVLKRLSIAHWEVHTQLPNGKSNVNRWLPSTAATGYPVPTSSADDGYTPGVDCLFNTGAVRSGGGGTGGGGYTPPPPPPPRQPRCGTSYIDDGYGREEERRTCQ